MTFIPSTDKRPVYIDSLGNPMSYGKLLYCEIGGDPSLLKSVYLNKELTIGAPNPLLLDLSGRTPTQVFLGTGDYTVRAYRFTGDDVNTAQPEDWALDNQWDESGFSAVDSSSTDVATLCVETIADLRLMSGNNARVIKVCGYYTANDMFARNYIWSPTSTAGDNNGTIIRNPNVAVGAWILNIEGNVVDCRIFGVIANRLEHNNTRINQLITAAQTNAGIPKTIYFPRGIYYVSGGSATFGSHVIFDDGVRFFNDVSDTYTITIAGTHDIRCTTAIQYGSVATVALKFTNTTFAGIIDPRWYGITYSVDTNVDMTSRFDTMITSLPSASAHTIVITGRLYVYYHQRMVTVKTNVEFRNKGQLHNGAIQGAIEFDQCVTITNNNNMSSIDSGVRHRCFVGYQSTFWFKTTQGNNGSVVGRDILCSWFFDKDNLLFSMSNMIIGKTGNRIIIDTEIYINDAFDDNGACKFVLTTGAILNATSSSWIKFNSLEWDGGLITPVGASNKRIVIRNQVVKPSWFARSTGDDNEWMSALQDALRSAFMGSGLCDLEGRKYHTEYTTGYLIDESANLDLVHIYNGFIYGAMTADTCYFDLANRNRTISINHLKFSDIAVYPDAPATNKGIFLNINTSIPKVTLDNVTYFSVAKKDCITLTATASVTNLYISDCDMRCGYLVGGNANAITGTINITNNRRLGCSLSLDGSQDIYINNNYIYNYNNDFWNIGNSHDGTINGNTFKGVQLQLMSYVRDGFALISHNVVGNKFISTSDHPSKINIIATAPNTRITGAVIEGNTFDASLSASVFNSVDPVTYGDGASYVLNGNNMISINGNSGFGNVVVKRTSGMFIFSCGQVYEDDTRFPILINGQPSGSYYEDPRMKFAMIATSRDLFYIHGTYGSQSISSVTPAFEGDVDLFGAFLVGNALEYNASVGPVMRFWTANDNTIQQNNKAVGYISLYSTASYQ